MPSFEETFWNAERFAKLFRANNLGDIEAQMRDGVFITDKEIFHAFSKLAASEELIRLVSKYYPGTTSDLLFVFIEIYYDEVCYDSCSRAGGSSSVLTDMKSGNLVLALKTLMPYEDSRNAMIVTLAERIHTEMGYNTIPRLFSERVRRLVEKVKTAYALQA
jgi:hypothetical protein